jgi:hypothetical protein
MRAGWPRLARKLLEQRDRLGELHVRRPAARVLEEALPHLVPVVVVPDVPPALPRDGERPVDVLDLDREHPARAEQDVVDLAAPVAVALDEGPRVAERAPQHVGDLLLTLDAALDGFLAVRRRPGRGLPGRSR